MAVSRNRHVAFVTLIAFASLVAAGRTLCAQADLGNTATATEAAALPLYLEVFINGHDIKLIANFVQLPDGRFTSPASELSELGIRVPEGAGPDVLLDDLPGLSYAYDEQKQAMSIMAEDSALVPKSVSGRGKSDLLAPQPGFGSVLNYGLFATTPDTLLDGDVDLSGASVSLDHRFYTPWGVLTNTGAIRTKGITYEGANAVRTDSYFTYVDQERMNTYTVGDVTISSLPWSRPIRIGGAQAKRDFSLRDDVISVPLLTASGSAAVPSTVDVYIGSVRTFTGSVDPGPFLLSDVPVIDRYGDARIVLRDVSGRETEVTVPFYASQYLLKQGMLDYSIEAGLARQDYGQESFSYGTDPVASGSLRYGVTDRLTVEAHAEAKSDLAMGGAGITTVLFNRAEATIAAGGSVYGGETGFFTYGRFSTEYKDITLSVSSFRSLGDFADLVYATGIDDLGKDKLNEDYNYLEPPKAMDAVTLGLPLFFDDSSVNLTFIHALREDDENFIASASYSRSLGWRDVTLRLNGFWDFGDDGGLGVLADVSMPLGGSTHLNIGVARDKGGKITPAASVQKPLGSEVGSYGYRVEGSGTDIYGPSGADASYRSSYGVAQAQLRANNGRASASARFDGALVMAGGGVFAANTIYDSFAVVDAGLPDVPVMLQNQPVATTGSNGKALVSGLRSYAKNRISIDVANLPVDATVEATDETVIPARRSGVTLKFNGGVKSSALLILRDASGGYLAHGSVAKVNGGDAEIFVGYDGQLWLEGLEASNTLTVENENGVCTASFAYTPAPGKQVIIDPVECK